MTAATTFTTAEVMAATGATYRQADEYWRTRHGWTGTGRQRAWPMTDVIRLAVGVELHALIQAAGTGPYGRTGHLTGVVLDLLDDTTCLAADSVVVGDGAVRVTVDLAAIRARL